MRTRSNRVIYDDSESPVGVVPPTLACDSVCLANILMSQYITLLTVAEHVGVASI